LKLSGDTLTAQLARALAPVYLVASDEPLLQLEAAAAIRAQALASGCTERELHFIDTAADWGKLPAAVNTLSLFAQRRLVELRLRSSKPGVAGAAVLQNLLAVEDPDRVLLIMAPALDRDSQSAAWVRAIESKGVWVQINSVAPEQFPQWLQRRAGALKLQLTSDAIALLAERTQGNLLAAQQELEKLRLALPEAVTAVSVDELYAVLADSARFDVFQLGEAALGGEAVRALRILQGLHSEGVESILVLWSISKAVRDLWAAVAPQSTQPPRVWGRQKLALEQGRRRAGRLRFAQLITHASRIDRIIKGRASGDAWNEMALLTAEFCGYRV
jgi:DNA polymerase III subunit delta